MGVIRINFEIILLMGVIVLLMRLKELISLSVESAIIHNNLV